MACPVFHSVPAACSSLHILCLSCKACCIFEGVVFQLSLPYYCRLMAAGVILQQLHLPPKDAKHFISSICIIFLSVISMTFDLLIADPRLAISNCRLNKMCVVFFSVVIFLKKFVLANCMAKVSSTQVSNSEPSP